MPVCEHQVSFRNGSQIMVAGLKLQRELGYCRGAMVRITDPSGNAGNAPWHFVVANDEHATLTSKNPPPPAWIRPGVRIRIEVGDALAAPVAQSLPAATPLAAPVVRRVAPAAAPIATATDLAEWRRAVLRILDRLEANLPLEERRSPAARIDALSRAGTIPRHVAAMMRTVTETRNFTEYEDASLSRHESDAARAAWGAVRAWAQSSASR